MLMMAASVFSTKLARKRAERSNSLAAYSVPFQDHLALESNFDFRIILRLENAPLRINCRGTNNRQSISWPLLLGTQLG